MLLLLNDIGNLASFAVQSFIALHLNSCLELLSVLTHKAVFIGSVHASKHNSVLFGQQGGVMFCPMKATLNSMESSCVGGGIHGTVQTNDR